MRVRDLKELLAKIDDSYEIEITTGSDTFVETDRICIGVSKFSKEPFVRLGSKESIQMSDGGFEEFTLFGVECS